MKAGFKPGQKVMVEIEPNKLTLKPESDGNKWNKKQRLPILQVLAYYNLKPDRNNQIKCPFHEDDKPSIRIYPGTNTFHCFGCNATGDQVEFVEKYEKCSKPAILWETAI